MEREWFDETKDIKCGMDFHTTHDAGGTDVEGDKLEILTVDSQERNYYFSGTWIDDKVTGSMDLLNEHDMDSIEGFKVSVTFKANNLWLVEKMVNDFAEAAFETLLKVDGYATDFTYEDAHEALMGYTRDKEIWLYVRLDGEGARYTVKTDRYDPVDLYSYNDGSIQSGTGIWMELLFKEDNTFAARLYRGKVWELRSYLNDVKEL